MSTCNVKTKSSCDHADHYNSQKHNHSEQQKARARRSHSSCFAFPKWIVRKIPNRAKKRHPAQAHDASTGLLDWKMKLPPEYAFGPKAAAEKMRKHPMQSSVQRQVMMNAPHFSQIPWGGASCSRRHWIMMTTPCVHTQRPAGILLPALHLYKSANELICQRLYIRNDAPSSRYPSSRNRSCRCLSWLADAYAQTLLQIRKS